MFIEKKKKKKEDQYSSFIFTGERERQYLQEYNSILVRG